ncbi:ESCRT-III subunit protein snf7 [Balamuthia mandrillaris]
MKLFGRAKKTASPKESIAKLRETLDMLEKREDYLQKKIDKEIQFAKLHASKNKRAALMALKRKKTYEQQRDKISGAMSTIEQQLMAIEGAAVSLEAMKAMRIGAQAMRGIHGEISIDKVDDTMDEIKEQMDIAAEINDAISQPLGDPIDEDELERELAELQAEDLDAQLLGIDTATTEPTHTPESTPSILSSSSLRFQCSSRLSSFSAVPNVPTRTPVAVELSPEELELNALKESMAYS